MYLSFMQVKIINYISYLYSLSSFFKYVSYELSRHLNFHDVWKAPISKIVCKIALIRNSNIRIFHCLQFGRCGKIEIDPFFRISNHRSIMSTQKLSVYSSSTTKKRIINMWNYTICLSLITIFPLVILMELRMIVYVVWAWFLRLKTITV